MNYTQEINSWKPKKRYPKTWHMIQLLAFSITALVLFWAVTSMILLVGP